MKTFNKTYIRVLDHLLGVEKHLSVFFPISLYLLAAYVYKNRKKAQTFTKSAVYGLGLFPSRPQGFFLLVVFEGKTHRCVVQVLA